MIVTIKNISNFLNNISDYIQTNYNIVPSDFIFDTIDDTEPVLYNRDCIKSIICPIKHLHAHNNKNIYCSIPERVAIIYIHNSIFGSIKKTIIKNLRNWLPEVTLNSVHVSFSDSIQKICCNLEPAYALHFFNITLSTDTFYYTYISSTSEEKEQTDCSDFYTETKSDLILKEYDLESLDLIEYPIIVNKTKIMVRARSPTGSRRRRRRSTSVDKPKSGRVGKRRTSKSGKRRSRSRSGSRSRAGKRSTRARSQ